MSSASLPMYDFPEARAATDAWWAGLRRHLAGEGVADTPSTLLRRDDLIEQWSDPALLISQTCGYLLAGDLRNTLQPVATPHYTVAGCAGPDYASVILVRDSPPAAELEEFRGGVGIYSRLYSHAGYNALRGIIAPLAGGSPFFSKVIGSGSHIDSIRLLATGAGDIATVCSVIYAFVSRWRPEALLGTRVLGYTPLAPAPPYVAPIGATRQSIAQLRSAFAAAMVDPALASVREDLYLGGISILDRTAYDRIRDVEKAAVALDYPELC
ncbi:MAG: PhnD/SsuA/transferrin family substrate-binding protein [Gammaproteobacteria bacterium]